MFTFSHFVLCIKIYLFSINSYNSLLFLNHATTILYFGNNKQMQQLFKTMSKKKKIPSVVIKRVSFDMKSYSLKIKNNFNFVKIFREIDMKSSIFNQYCCEYRIQYKKNFIKESITLKFCYKLSLFLFGSGLKRIVGKHPSRLYVYKIDYF